MSGDGGLDWGEAKNNPKYHPKSSTTDLFLLASNTSVRSLQIQTPAASNPTGLFPLECLLVQFQFASLGR